MAQSNHVFLSYCRDNKAQAQRLRKELVAHGFDVWWDDDIPVGGTWQIERDRALEQSFAVVACFSEEVEKRDASGMYPELRDAIKQLRMMPPGSIYLLPLRFSSCVIPKLRIDDSSTLHDLQFVDLFPDNAWDGGVGRLVSSLRGIAPGDVAADQAPPRAFTDKERKARARYLDYVREDVENRLQASIHNARFIDLGIKNVPGATHLPWRYKNPFSGQEYTSLQDAYQASHGRLLLLGKPGSGKTTTLLDIAQRLIAEAANPSAPIPLIVNLSKFRFATPSSNKLSRFLPWRTESKKTESAFDAWLATEFTNFPGISASMARNWIQQGRIAALLDGLDEVTEKRRADLVRLLNSTFLWDYPDIIVVVCSRVTEYQRLQEREETKLQLPGAAALQELSPSQIQQYLEAARATGLQEGFEKDPSLRELAQTPLTLSMMTLAYAGYSPSQVPSNLSLTEQRHHLMESYVDRMLQRKERRRLGKPLDDNRSTDISEEEFLYPPDDVNRYLGRLAVQLSTRMQTSFALNRFYRFLSLNLESGSDRLLVWATNFSIGVFAFLCMLLIAITRTQFSLWDVGLAAMTIAIATGLLVIAGRDIEIRRLSVDASDVSSVVLLLAAFLSYGAISCALSNALPFGIAPLSMGLIAGTTVLSAIAAIALFGQHRRVSLLIMCTTIATYACALALSYFVLVDWQPGRALALCLVISVTFWWAHGAYNQEGWGGAIAVPAILVFILVLAAASTWLSINLDVPLSFICISAVIVGTLIANRDAVVPILGLTIVAAIGGLFGGDIGMTLASALFGCLVAFYGVFKRTAVVKSIHKVKTGRIEGIGDHIEEFVLCPSLCLALWIARQLPLLFRRFLNYCETALLIKRSGPDIEFIHRLLRDYFAMRDLQPRLRNENRLTRLKAIAATGYQGISAIDTLAELATTGPTDERVAAIMALGMIPSPEVESLMERAVRDPVPALRAAALRSLQNIDSHLASAWLDTAALDAASEVQLEVMNVAVKRLDGDPAARLVLRVLANAMGNEIEYLRHVSSVIAQTLSPAAKIVAGELPEWTSEPLAQFMESDDVKVRLGAIKLIRRLTSSRAKDRILECLVNDPSGGVRYAAARTLAELDAPWAVVSLIQALTDREKKVATAAANALEAKCGRPQDVEDLIKYLGNSVAAVRSAAARALGQLEDFRAVEPLIGLLRDRSEQVRVSAAAALGKLSDRRAIEPLIRLLKDRNTNVRGSAAEALGRLSDSQCVDPLIQLLGDRNSEVRRQAVVALDLLRDPRAIKPLIMCLADRNRSVGVAAALALGRFGHPIAVEYLVKALLDRDQYVRIQAAFALGQLKDPRSVKALINALTDKEIHVRRHAKQSLESIGTPEALAAIKSYNASKFDVTLRPFELESDDDDLEPA